MLRFLLGISLFLIGVVCQAQTQTQGPPDTIVSCLGKDDCIRCFLFTPSGEYPIRLTTLEPSDSCQKSLQSKQVFSQSLDIQTNAYARRNELKTGNDVQNLSYRAMPGNLAGVPLGASEFVLSSQMYQHIQAEKSKDMSKRVGSIESAINQSTFNLKESFRKTVEALPLSDADLRTRLTAAAADISTATIEAQQRVDRIRSLPREEIPPRTTNEEPFVASGMTKDMLAQSIRNQIPPEHLRSEGRDLDGILRRAEQHGDKGQLVSERAKLAAAHTRGDIGAEDYARMEAQIDRATVLAESTEPKAKIIAKRLLADTQSERQVAEGKTNIREVTTVDSEDNLRTVTQNRSEVVPDSSLGFYVTLVYQRIGVALDRSVIAVDISKAYSDVDANRRRNVAATAMQMAQRAEKALQNGDLNTAELLAEFSLGIAEFAIGWVPWLSVTRSMYELITGRDAFSNQQLTNLELAGRVIDIVSAGIGSKFFKGWDTVNRISQHIGDSERYKKIIASAKKYSDRMTKLGRNPEFFVQDLAHLADSHMPGGANLAAREGKDLATVFLDGVDPLELTAEAAELIANKSDAVKIIADRSKGTSEFIHWNREGLEIIGRGVNDPVPIRDVGLILNKTDGRPINLYPWHPKNPKP